MDSQSLKKCLHGIMMSRYIEIKNNCLKKRNNSCENAVVVVSVLVTLCHVTQGGRRRKRRRTCGVSGATSAHTCSSRWCRGGAWCGAWTGSGGTRTATPRGRAPSPGSYTTVSGHSGHSVVSELHSGQFNSTVSDYTVVSLIALSLNGQSDSTTQ